MEIITFDNPLSIETGLTKSQLGTMAVNFVNNTTESGNFLKAAEMIAQTETLVKLIKENKILKDGIRDDISKHGREYQSGPVKMELAEVGTKYDYSQCGDSELKDLYETLEQIKAKVEEREKFLKNLPLSGLDVITADGEAIHVYPPAKSSTSSYKVTIAK